jgi:methionyl-tRNA synthetase
LGTVMYHLAESIRMVSVLISPFMTRTPGKIWEQIGIQEGPLTTWESIQSFGKLPGGTQVRKGAPIFPRIDIKKELESIATAEEKEKASGGQQAKAEEKAEEVVPEITIDDFYKTDLRVAKVLKAEKVEKADKLLKLEVQLGDEIRTVVSGIAKYYTPEEMVGRKVILVANLKPVKLRGILSQGMILAAEDDKGKLVLATVDQEIESGSQVR